MHIIFTLLRKLLASPERPRRSPDPLRHFTPSELADLPPHHPLHDPCA